MKGCYNFTIEDHFIKRRVLNPYHVFVFYGKKRQLIIFGNFVGEEFGVLEI